MTSLDYIEALVELSFAGRPRPLKRVIDARIRGETEPVRVAAGGAEREIASPPLERDEPDRNAVLYTVYSILRRADESDGLEDFRRAAVELFMAGLNRAEDVAYLQALGRLIGHVRVVDSEELRPQLRLQLYGLLEESLGRPFDRLISLDGEALERATVALDVWVAVVKIQPHCRPHHEERLEELFHGNLAMLQQNYLVLEPRLRFLFLTFRALMKVKPEVAGARGLWPLVKLIDKHSAELPRIRRRWLGTCRHLGVVLAANPAWRSSFLAGMERFQFDSDFAEGLRLPLFRESLEKLDGMWDEVSNAWRPRRPRSRRVALRAIAGGAE